MRLKIETLILLAVCLFQVVVHAQISIVATNAPKIAQNVLLAWDASPDAAVTGYYLYYGTNTGAYTARLDVGNVLTTTINITPRGCTYYFAAVAHDANGQESPPSNEISYSVPNLIPQASLVLLPAASIPYGSTNLLVTTGGSGSGAVTYSILSGPGFLTSDSNNIVVTAASGTIILQATKAADDVYLAASVTNIIAVTQAPQVITIATIPDQKETNTVALSATASSGLPVTFSILSGPGILSGAQLSFSGPGAVVVGASQPGNSLYSAATPVSATVRVGAVVWPGLTLSANTVSFENAYSDANPASKSLILNNTGEIAITYTNVVTYSTNASRWLTLSPQGGSLAGYGSVTLVANVNSAGLSAGTYYATNSIISPQATNSPAIWVAQLTVDRANQSTLVFNPTATQACGTTNSLNATGGSGTGAISYSVVSGPAVLVGGGSQLVLTAGSGQVVVQAAKAGDSNYYPTNINAIVTATKGTQTISFPLIGSQKSTNTVALAATATSRLPISYVIVSGPGSISAGILHFSGVGTVRVAASQPGDSNWQSATSVTNSVQVLPYLTAPASFRIVSGN